MTRYLKISASLLTLSITLWNPLYIDAGTVISLQASSCFDGHVWERQGTFVIYSGSTQPCQLQPDCDHWYDSVIKYPSISAVTSCTATLTNQFKDDIGPWAWAVNHEKFMPCNNCLSAPGSGTQQCGDVEAVSVTNLAQTSISFTANVGAQKAVNMWLLGQTTIVPSLSFQAGETWSSSKQVTYSTGCTATANPCYYQIFYREGFRRKHNVQGQVKFSAQFQCQANNSIIGGPPYNCNGTQPVIFQWMPDSGCITNPGGNCGTTNSWTGYVYLRNGRESTTSCTGGTLGCTSENCQCNQALVTAAQQAQNQLNIRNNARQPPPNN